MVGYPSDSLASCSIYKNLIYSFILHYLTFKIETSKIVKFG